MTLWFLWETGCDYCADAKPALEEFRTRHPEVEVISHDLTVEDWREDAPVLGPESVPAYVLVDGRLTRTLQSRGALTADELERWVFGPG